MSSGDDAVASGPNAGARLAIGHHVVRLATVPSTMEVAAHLAGAGAPGGTVVLADVQSAGRGRAGRAWSAPAGTAILGTVIFRPTPPRGWPLLSLLAGVAVAETIEIVTGRPVGLKWPNDVWLGPPECEAKVAGILLTSRPGVRDGFVLLGIGINVNQTATDLPPGATSLRHELGRTVDRAAVAEILWRRLDRAEAAFTHAAGRPDLAPWSRRAALIGRRVEVADGQRVVAGVLIGIDDTGGLQLRDGAGPVITVVAGDLSRGPRLAPPG